LQATKALIARIIPPIIKYVVIFIFYSYVLQRDCVWLVAWLSN
jgi:hypothetical protein